MSFGILRAATLRQAARAGARNARVGFRGSFRSYSSEVPPAAKKSNTGLFVGLGAVAGVGLAYYVYANESDTVKSGVQAAKVKANFVPTKEDYQKVYNDITELLDAENYDDGSYGPVLVRLAWHASGTYDKESKTGGSNYATMRFAPESEHGANKGLQTARSLLEQVKEKHPWISYGDLWTLGGVAAIQEMGGPKIPWRPGRIDGFSINATPDGRLPDATQGSDHVRAIFGRMGFNDQEMVALIGAHALGRCHRDRSGFEGPWTFSPITVTNDFYKLLFSETWRWKKWEGPKQLEDKATGSLMMLPTDYVLVTDKSFKKYAKAYAQDQDVWFKDFSAATARLFELGVPEQQWVTAEPWSLKTVDEQADEKKKD